MPIPIILGIAVAMGTIYGVSKAVSGNDRERAQKLYEENKEQWQEIIEQYNSAQEKATIAMDRLGKLEIEILSSFRYVDSLVARIRNRLNDLQPLHDVFVGAEVLLQALERVPEGTAGTIAALGGAAVAAMVGKGKISKERFITSFSEAEENSSLEECLGSIMTTEDAEWWIGLGPAKSSGEMIGVFLASPADDAQEAWSELQRVEKGFNMMCSFFAELSTTAALYQGCLQKIKGVYDTHILFLEKLLQKKTDWSLFSDKEQLNVDNLVRLTSVFYNMCQERFVLERKRSDGIIIPILNRKGIGGQIEMGGVTIWQIPAIPYDDIQGLREHGHGGFFLL